MTKVLRCRDTGADCDFEARGETEEEIMQQVGPHATDVHKMEITPELVEKVRGAIQDE